jgi:BirA family biotin operon repressor/biotin-[acetyl-CoA-carboxylase] ligase
MVCGINTCPLFYLPQTISLIMPNPPLNAALIQTMLSTPLIKRVFVFPVLDSSNEWTLHHADCGEVCLVETQTAGRGRRGRQWYSPPQTNLYCSLKWCFETRPHQMGLLSLVVAVALAECLHAIGLRGHRIKWPNDIVYKNQKLAGILIESKRQDNTVVIGIGLNVHMSHDQDVHQTAIDQAWTSVDTLLQAQKNKPKPASSNRNNIASQLLNTLAKHLTHFSTLDFQQFLLQWQRWDALQEKNVNVIYASQQRPAQVIGIDSQGALRVCLADGSEKTLYSADISLRFDHP